MEAYKPSQTFKPQFPKLVPIKKIKREKIENKKNKSINEKKELNPKSSKDRSKQFRERK